MSEWDIINAAIYPSACKAKKERKKKKKGSKKSRKKDEKSFESPFSHQKVCLRTRAFVYYYYLNTQDDSTQTER